MSICARSNKLRGPIYEWLDEDGSLTRPLNGGRVLV